jgi:uncharacterized HAD superfamily protein
MISRISSAAKIDPRTLAFDIDGVVADTMELFLTLAREEYGISHIGYDDITDYHLETCLDMDPDILAEILERLMDGDYAYPLKPIKGAADVLTRLGRHNGGLLFVTARPYPGPIEDWLKDLTELKPGWIKIEATGGFEAKLKVLKQHGKLGFVEDRLETCRHLAAAGIEPILFRQPWNREPHAFLEVANWEELAQLIDFPES